VRGRTIIFFVDDMHLSIDGHKRVRTLLQRFAEREMSEDDRVLVVSTTGKVGFLQQFTDNKSVVLAAAARLVYSRNRSASDRQNPPMNEYEAFAIDHYDTDVTQKFVAIYLKEMLATDTEDALSQIRSRSRTILQIAGAATKSTLTTLEQAVRKSAAFPGRKVVFLLSDGFLLDNVNTDVSQRLQRVTDAAARANAVVYSLDVKGLDAGFAEGTAASFRLQSDERWSLGDPLNAIARNTGGRFIRNQNDLQAGVAKSLEESSVYYLLAWRPDPERKGPDRLRRIEVTVKGRPELTVRVQNGYLDAGPKEESKPGVATAKEAAKVAPKTPEDELRSAFNSPLPKRTLPTALAVNYLDTPQNGAVLSASIQIKGEALEFTPSGDKATANVDVVGVVYNSAGKREGFFRELLTVSGPASGAVKAKRSDIFYNYQAKLAPGLYQVRVAARESKKGLVGSAAQWIEIPDLASHKLALSSLLIGERPAEVKTQQVSTSSPAELAGVSVSVSRRFANTSRLRYLVYVYNAARGRAGTAAPDVTLQTQVLRGGRAVVASPPRQLNAAGQDPARIPYLAEVPLEGLPAGRYVLQVTAVDRVAGTTATERVSFEIE
jgi:VWFA-related protein